MLGIAGLMRLRNQRGVAQDVVDRNIKNSRQDFVDQITTSRTQETREDLHRILQTDNSKHSRKALFNTPFPITQPSVQIGVEQRWSPHPGSQSQCSNWVVLQLPCTHPGTPGAKGDGHLGTLPNKKQGNKGTPCEHEIVVVVMDNSNIFKHQKRPNNNFS